jgi:hypothetical protein
LWCLSVIPQGASASVVGGKTPTTASNDNFGNDDKQFLDT